ncbi:MAG: hypothetical protein M3O36_14035 [Myxococcota bacterium]|nr:hypothetical protein [Myxococcota bacterium]
MRTITTRPRILTVGSSLLLTVTACTNSTANQSTTHPGAGQPAAQSDAGAPMAHPSAGDAGSPLPGPNGGSGSGTATAGARANACLPDPSDDQCSTCLKSSCCDAFAACVRDTSCVGLLQCGNACGAGDSNCGAQCAASYPSGETPALALVTCQQASCTSACSVAAPPTNSGGQPAGCLPDSAVPPGSPDCASLVNTPVERDCPFGSPDAACVPAPGGSANVFCCPSGTGATPGTGGPIPSPASGGTPGAGVVDPQAVGLWVKSNTSGVDFTNGSGNFSSPSGTKAIFQFTADGQYLFETFSQASLYSCTMALLGRETGTVMFHGAGFTLAPVTARVLSQDSCNVSNNYEKPWQNRLDGPFEYTWSVGPDPSGSGRRVLSVTYLADGSSEVLVEQPAQ